MIKTGDNPDTCFGRHIVIRVREIFREEECRCYRDGVIG